MTAVPLALIGWFGGLGFIWGLTGVAFWILLIGFAILVSAYKVCPLPRCRRQTDHIEINPPAKNISVGFAGRREPS